MHKSLIIVLAVCWSVVVGQAQDSVPVIRILPEDLEQDSAIQQCRLSTNKFVVRWTYTESGAKKMLEFWNAHTGEEVVTRIGTFEGRGRISETHSPGWAEGWLKWRTDKLFGVTEDEAKKIVAGLKGK